MPEKKKPDHVVYNEIEGRYDASLKPYASDIGAPAITTTDTVAWKNRNVKAVNHQIEAEH